MNKKQGLVILAIVIGAGVFYFFHREPTPKRAVRARLTALAEAMNRVPNEKATTLALKNRKLVALFMPRCTLRLPRLDLSGEYSADEIGSMATRYRVMFQSLKVRFRNVRITLMDANSSSVVDCIADVTVIRNGEASKKSVNLSMELEKKEKAWKISQVEIVSSPE